LLNGARDGDAWINVATGAAACDHDAFLIHVFELSVDSNGLGQSVG
jgi:hypothetical protein